MDAGAALVACWADCGLDTAFTVPGESFLPVLEALRQRRGQFHTVSMRHEGGCTFAALAYGARARKPAVAMVSRGPGATNAAIGVHAAHQDSVPMVLMIGHVRRHMRGRESFQEIDATSMFASMSKGVFQPETPEQVVSMAREAIALSMAGRPGPVVLVMPRDLGEAPAPDLAAAEPGALRTVVSPPPAAVAAMADRLAKAEKPLILAGELARDPEVRPALSALARRLGAPVLAAYRAQDVLDNNDPAYAGHLEI
ncbi:MAG: thiamine pyrophosphate-binding protein, partial [Thalassobaculaceae bacterium]